MLLPWQRWREQWRRTSLLRGEDMVDEIQHRIYGHGVIAIKASSAGGQQLLCRAPILHIESF